jgi:hypothetical protein
MKNTYLIKGLTVVSPFSITASPECHPAKIFFTSCLLIYSFATPPL